MKLYLAIFLLVCYCTLLMGGFSLNWQSYNGSQAMEGANAVCRMGADGFALAGFRNSQDSAFSSICIISCDNNGNELWSSEYSNGSFCYATGICRSLDAQGLIITGYQLSDSTTGFDIFMMKIDDSGNLLWQQVYELAGWQQAEAVCSAGNEGYMICGSIAEEGEEDDIFILKTDPAGDTLWTRTYGCEKLDTGNDIIPQDDGSFIICGSTGLYDLPYPGSDGRNRELYLMRINSSGDVLAEQSYWIMNTNQNSFDLGEAVCSASDGGLYITGSTSQHYNELMDIAVLKVDAELNEVWKSHLELDNFYDWGYGICEDEASGNIYVCGSGSDNQQTESRLVAAALDAQGNFLDLREFPDWGPGSGNAILMTDNGEIIIAGYGANTIGSNTDFRLLSLSMIQIDTDQNELLPGINGFYNYPNPFNPHTTIYLIKTPVPEQNTEFTIYNARGQRVKSFSEITSSTISWNGSDDEGYKVASGIYFGCLRSGKQTFYNPMVLIK